MLEGLGMGVHVHKDEFSLFHSTPGGYSHTPMSNYIIHYNMQSICIYEDRRARVSSFLFYITPSHIIEGEEQVPGPIRIESMFLSDHQDVYPLFG